ncbi:MAG: alpha-L-rhamnosidase [Chloroflexi bacterium]|nr:alpha-L-rhamnosidase [Chloroflexota bacterium]
MRVAYQGNPFPNVGAPGSMDAWGCPVHWIWHPDCAPGDAAVLAFRLPFHLDKAATIRVHLSADQRYEFFCDGVRQGRGPERGDPAHWSFETYELKLDAGDHLLAVRAWWLPRDGSPMAQMTLVPGFLLMAEAPYTELLSTGAAEWQVCRMNTFTQEPVNIRAYFVVGWSFLTEGSQLPWGWQHDAQAPGDWQAAAKLRVPVGGNHNPYYGLETADRLSAPFLVSAQLPAMIEVPRQLGTVRQAESPDAGEAVVLLDRHQVGLAAEWQVLLEGKGSLKVPAGSSQRLIIDLGDYYCAFPELETSGGNGAMLRMGWAEGLFEPGEGHHMHKGNRDEVANKIFIGPHDRFVFEGGQRRVYDTLWWRCGRYVEINIATAEDALTIERLVWREERYPLENKARFEANDARLASTIPMMFRTLQMCSHETYMDCPFYEQLMYAGDGRLEVLVTYLTDADCLLPEKSVQLFDWSRAADGLTKSRYPSQIPQVIPGFSAWWVAMVHDLMMWRGDSEIVKKSLLGVDAVLAGLAQYLQPNGLMIAPRGWNFCDWVPTWSAGIPPEGVSGYSALLNLIYLYALQRGVSLHETFGHSHLAAHWGEVAGRLKRAIADTFWDASRGLLADDPNHTLYSEHVQALAILTDTLDAERQAMMVRNLLSADIARCTVYFSHYLFEAYAKVGEMDALIKGLDFWFDLAKQGFKTVLESPEPSRSDCHAWGAHPIYHYFTSIFGAKPVAPGAARLRIQPQLGPLNSIRGAFPHIAGGEVRFDLHKAGNGLQGSITLPDGVTGSLVTPQGERELHAGDNQL